MRHFDGISTRGRGLGPQGAIRLLAQDLFVSIRSKMAILRVNGQKPTAQVLRAKVGVKIKWGQK